MAGPPRCRVSAGAGGQCAGAVHGGAHRWTDLEGRLAEFQPGCGNDGVGRRGKAERSLADRCRNGSVAPDAPAALEAPRSAAGIQQGADLRGFRAPDLQH